MRVAAKLAFLFQDADVTVDRGGGAETYGGTYLADGWRVAVVGAELSDEVHNCFTGFWFCHDSALWFE